MNTDDERKLGCYEWYNGTDYVALGPTQVNIGSTCQNAFKGTNDCICVTTDYYENTEYLDCCSRERLSVCQTSPCDTEYKVTVEAMILDFVGTGDTGNWDGINNNDARLRIRMRLNEGCLYSYDTANETWSDDILWESTNDRDSLLDYYEFNFTQNPTWKWNQCPCNSITVYVFNDDGDFYCEADIYLTSPGESVGYWHTVDNGGEYCNQRIDVRIKTTPIGNDCSDHYTPFYHGIYWELDSP
jgi:hypothetical protein